MNNVNPRGYPGGQDWSWWALTGWGWGLPRTWEGWVVLAGYLALLALCLKVFPPHQNLPAFIISVHVLSGLLIAIYWWKGESPKWRWG